MENENNQQDQNTELNKTNVMPKTPQEAQEQGQMQTNAVSTPPVNNQGNVPPESIEKDSKVGPIIGSIIIILIILVGGLYFWNSILENRAEDNSGMMEEDSAEDESVAELESELEALDTASMESELDAIDEEFDSN